MELTHEQTNFFKHEIERIDQYNEELDRPEKRIEATLERAMAVLTDDGTSEDDIREWCDPELPMDIAQFKASIADMIDEFGSHTLLDDLLDDSAVPARIRQVDGQSIVAVVAIRDGSLAHFMPFPESQKGNLRAEYFYKKSIKKLTPANYSKEQLDQFVQEGIFEYGTATLYLCHTTMPSDALYFAEEQV